MLKRLLVVGALISSLIGGSVAGAVSITYNDTLLASGFSVDSGGVNLTTTTSDGALSLIGSGTFTGLYIGVNDADGNYVLTFSELIDSILIEFDALSNTGGQVPETISNFATDNGPVSIMYTNQIGTLFDGSTITSDTNDGQGIIEYSGAAFSQFIFNHAQDPGQNGFVIERIVINTIDGMSEIPLPPAVLLFGMGLAGLGAVRRRKMPS